MRFGKMATGIITSVIACVLSIVLTTIVINSELIMFDKYNLDKLIMILIGSVAIQIIFYITWFVIKTKESSRNADKLAKESLLVCFMSIAVSDLLLFGMSALFSLWEDGNLFLIVAAVLYMIAGLIQYIFCRPY